MKYDGRGDIFSNPDVLPMWIADMDFATPQFILNRIVQRCQHPILGYTFRDAEYHQAIVDWYERSQGWSVESQWIDFCPGVVSGLAHAIRAYTRPGDRIIIQPPVYPPFFATARENGRDLVLNPLVEASNGYRMDFEGLERLASQGAKMFILCNPHNPVGRVWAEEELRLVGNICLKYGVLVVSDEIHSDLVFSGHVHRSLAAMSEELAQSTVTFGSSSKTFNVAGLNSGYVIIPSPQLRKLYREELQASGSGMGNIFGIEAVKAAFSAEGRAWLEAMLRYVNANIDFVEEFIAHRLPGVRMHRPEGTYLLWLDFRALELPDEELHDLLVSKAGVGLNRGSSFGEHGEGFARMNVACPLATVHEAMERIAAALE